MGVYGLQNLSKEYILSFFPQQKSIPQFNIKDYENILLNTKLFESVIIKKKGEDTIDLIVILKEKSRFSLSPLKDITPSNKYTLGLKIIDRFFLKKEQKLEVKGYTINLKAICFYFENYRWNISPFIKAEAIEYEYPENFLIFENELLVGFFKRKNHFDYSISYGEGSVNVYGEGRDFFTRLSSNMQFSNNFWYNSFNLKLDLYPFEKIFWSFSLKSFIRYPFKIFLFVPKIRAFIQDGDVPFYRKIIFGGYRNLKSYPFMKSKGNSGYIFEPEIVYQIMPQVEENTGIETFLFIEMGNTFDDYEDILRKKVLKGIGFALRFFTRNYEPLTLFVSYNQEGKIRFGIGIE